jgi:hypothetical protein
VVEEETPKAVVLAERIVQVHCAAAGDHEHVPDSQFKQAIGYDVGNAHRGKSPQEALSARQSPRP